MTVILVVLTIAVFLGVDWLLHRGRAVVPARVAARPAVRLPTGVFFAPSHTWLSLFPTGAAWLGIDDFVAQLLDRPQVKFLAGRGDHVSRGAPLMKLSEDGRALTIRSPIDGRVTALNPALATDPGLLQRAPFSEGWACELTPDRPADLKSLLLGGESRDWLREEFARLRDLFAGAGGALEPAMLQDGGPPIAGAMRLAGADVWERFDHEFLEVR